MLLIGEVGHLYWMHILFSPEEASDVWHFGMAFNRRFKHVNRLCERYFLPILSFFRLSDGYALILRSKPVSVVFHTRSPQTTDFTDIRMANPKQCKTPLFPFIPQFFQHLWLCCKYSPKEVHSLTLAQEGGRFPAVMEELFTEFCWQIFRCQTVL